VNYIRCDDLSFDTTSMSLLINILKSITILSFR